MMIRTQNLFEKNALLPFNITKGSVNRRDIKAWKYWNSFATSFANVKIHDVNSFSDAINDSIAPNKINFMVMKEKNPNCLGSLATKISSKYKSDENLNIIHYAYRFGLPLDEKYNIKDALTAVHEARHFFENLFHPKVAYVRVQKLINKEEFEDCVDKLRTLILSDLQAKFDKKVFKNKFDEYVQRLPDDVAIEALQKNRYSIKSERNACLSELFFLFKQNPFKHFLDIIDVSISIHDYHFGTREKIVEQKLRELLTKARGEIKNYKSS